MNRLHFDPENYNIFVALTSNNLTWCSFDEVMLHKYFKYQKGFRVKLDVNSKKISEKSNGLCKIHNSIRLRDVTVFL